MSENLLVDALTGVVSLESLKKWINGDLVGEEIKLFEKYECSKSDFISYFLNFVHENAIIYDRFGEAPQRIRTPKSIRKREFRDLNPKRRPRLFPENDIDENDPQCSNISTSETKTSEISDSSQEDRLGLHVTTSTPKMNKTQSESSNHQSYNSKFNLSHMSPSSPLFNRLNNMSNSKNFMNPSRNGSNTSTPRHSKQKLNISGSFERSSPGISLGDCIVVKKTSAKKKGHKNNENTQNDTQNSAQRKRRITPTNACRNISISFQTSENSFNFKETIREVSPESTNDQRNLLAEERKKILCRTNNSNEAKTPKKIKLAMIQNHCEVKPDVTQVTHKSTLDNMVEIYTFLVLKNFVLNVTGEIHFMLSLLLTKFDSKFETKCEEGELQVLEEQEEKGVLSFFESLHNNVYFAANSLSKIFELLHYLDAAALGLLRENERFKMFALEVPKISGLVRQRSESLPSYQNDTGVPNVCFNSDTDNRENFPSELSFHAFRKQRDLFYEIVMIWEQNHMNSSWNFSMMLGGRLRALLSISSEASNYRHLAKLFKAQLLSSCSKNSVKEEGISEHQLPFLSELPNMNAEKLNRLKSRLVTKQITNGINSLPSFHGVQEFYRDFILTASSYGFNEHLKITFASEIVDLNNSKFESSEFEDTDTSVDTLTQEKFLSCIKSLRIAAKFLGFLEALPYQIDKKISEKLLAAEMNARKFYRPQLDIKNIVIDSLENGHLVLTIPWVVKYLAMLDYVTLRLPYFSEVFDLLFSIYSKKYLKKYPNEMSILSRTLIDLSLGWLFELMHFPSELYFLFLERDSLDLPNLNTLRISASNMVEYDMRLDNLDLVNQTVLLVCCPYIEEIKKLLHTKISSRNIKIKHITPLTADESLSEMTEKRLKAQLEDSFFNCQPHSVRKTVDFVSERVASVCVKKICSTIVPVFKAQVLEKFKSYLLTFSDLDAPRVELCEQLSQTSVDQCQDTLKELKTACLQDSKKLIEERVTGAINLMLPTEDLDQVKEVCCTISKRNCLQRVQQWMSGHLNRNIFTKELDAEITKFVTSQGKCLKERPTLVLPPQGRRDQHNAEAKSVYEIILLLRKYICSLFRDETSTEKDLIAIIDTTVLSYQTRCDVNDSAINTINRMLMDAVLMTIAKQPLVVSGSQNNYVIVQRIVEFFKDHEKNCDDLCKNLVSPRNALMMMQSLKVEESWKTFSDFLAILLSKGLVSCGSFETQCLSLFRIDLDPEILDYITKSFKRIVDNGLVKGQELEFLLSFLSDYCSDI